MSKKKKDKVTKSKCTEMFPCTNNVFYKGMIIRAKELISDYNRTQGLLKYSELVNKLRKDIDKKYSENMLMSENEKEMLFESLYREYIDIIKKSSNQVDYKTIKDRFLDELNCMTSNHGKWENIDKSWIQIKNAKIKFIIQMSVERYFATKNIAEIIEIYKDDQHKEKKDKEVDEKINNIELINRINITRKLVRPYSKYNFTIETLLQKIFNLDKSNNCTASENIVYILIGNMVYNEMSSFMKAANVLINDEIVNYDLIQTLVDIFNEDYFMSKIDENSKPDLNRALRGIIDEKKNPYLFNESTLNNISEALLGNNISEDDRRVIFNQIIFGNDEIEVQLFFSNLLWDIINNKNIDSIYRSSVYKVLCTMPEYIMNLSFKLELDNNNLNEKSIERLIKVDNEDVRLYFSKRELTTVRKKLLSDQIIENQIGDYTQSAIDRVYLVNKEKIINLYKDFWKQRQEKNSLSKWQEGVFKDFIPKLVSILNDYSQTIFEMPEYEEYAKNIFEISKMLCKNSDLQFISDETKDIVIENLEKELDQLIQIIDDVNVKYYKQLKKKND